MQTQNMSNPTILPSSPETSPKLSRIKDKFKQGVGHYQEALSQAGYMEDLKYMEDTVPRPEVERKSLNKRRRIVIWFNS